MVKAAVLLTAMTAINLRGGREVTSPIDYSRWNSLQYSSSGESASASEVDDEATWRNQETNLKTHNLSKPELLPFPGIKDLTGSQEKVDVDKNLRKIPDKKSKEAEFATRCLEHATKRRQFLFKNRLVIILSE
jgi:hypothetical protein